VDADEFTTAYHEAGHVACTLALGWGVDSVTLDAGEYRGTVHTRERYRDYRGRALVALAGPAAQRAFCDDPDGCSIDQEAAERLATQQFNNADCRTAWLASVQADADRFVSGNWSPIRALAKALFRRRTLTGEQCREIAGF